MTLKGETMRYTTLIIGMLLIAMLLGACVPPQTAVPTTPPGTLDQRPSMQEVSLEGQPTQELKTFDDIEQLKRFLKERDLQSMQDQYDYDDGMVMRTMSSAPMADMVVAESSMGAPMPAQQVKMGGAEEYSSTNVQYAEVDEADYVKNDGRYIYMIADNKLVIIDAYDAKDADIVSETKIAPEDDQYDWRAPQLRQLFVEGNDLALVVETNEPAFYFERYDIEPRQTYKQKTVVHLYDVTDRNKPRLAKKVEVSGRYYQSRLVDGVMYLVSQESVRDGVFINEPTVRDVTSSRITMPTIHYFDNPEQNYQFNTVTSIELGGRSVIDAKTFMLGYSNTLMVSPENIYIAYQKQRHWYRQHRYEKERFSEVIFPLLPEEIKSKVRPIIASGDSEEEQWKQISMVLADFYRKFDQDEDLIESYEDVFEKIADAMEEYDTKKELEERKTVIQKIGIDNGKISYKAKGEVNGNLLNQFSLDEYDGMLRLATTVNLWTNRRVQYNNVYVLDENMNQVGELTGIAEDERIYSTRFMGDRLYMVTFKQMDPFFVIDLSNPGKPEILGALKIPGYSDYLHPYDANHIIGVGKETKANDFGGFQTQGVKIALFDVSDVKNPKEVGKVEIGDQGSDSEVLRDHKAFLFDKKRNMLVLPVAEVTKRDRINEYRWSNNIWNGAYVFEVSTDGFKELGKVKHSSQKSDYFSWRTQATVRRSLYMDDNLYTISDRYVKINDLGSDDLSSLNSIDLPGKFEDSRPVPMPEPRPMFEDVEVVEVMPEVVY